MPVKNSFVKQFDQNIKFNYSCFDRVILRGYIIRLFFAGGIAVLLRALGFNSLSNGVMRILTDQLNSHIEKIAKAQNIPIHWWPSVNGGTDGAKQKYVQEKYAVSYKGKDDHVYCILTDNEPSQTFACRELTSKAGKKFERLYKCRKPVKQYYIYFRDCLLGGCYLKISSYLPFQCEFYFNGHNAIAIQLDQRGIHYKLCSNAIVDIDDPEAIAEAVKSLTGRMVFDRITYWMNIFFKFNKGTYSTCSKFLHHDWYLAQIEVSSNIVFKSARFCSSLFERLLDKFHRLGLPETIAQIFSRRNHSATTSKTFWRLYDNNACIKHWFRGNSIKQYNKTGYFIRTETTINNPKSLGLKKPVLFLQAALWTGIECNDRMLNCCADVDVASIFESEPEKFSQPVMDETGRTITASDFRKTRQKALAEELIKPKYQAYGFSTADLLKNLPEHFRNPAQIRYEMNKMKARDVISKPKNKSFYRVTETGWKWLWLEICSVNHLKNPMISRVMKNQVLKIAEQPSQIEKAYELIQEGLTKLTQELAVIS
jgi:hypothetical protein